MTEERLERGSCTDCTVADRLRPGAEDLDKGLLLVLTGLDDLTLDFECEP